MRRLLAAALVGGALGVSPAQALDIANCAGERIRVVVVYDGERAAARTRNAVIGVGRSRAFRVGRASVGVRVFRTGAFDTLALALPQVAPGRRYRVVRERSGDLAWRGGGACG